MRPRREALCPLFVLHCRTMQRDVGDQKGSRSVDNDRVGLRELGQNVSRVLNRVKQRETLVVTEHGQPIAHLAPYQAENELKAMTARGEVTAASLTVQELFSRFQPLESHVLGSAIFKEMRDQEGR